MPTNKFQLNSNVYPGLSKIVEESGELQAVIGKLQATGGYDTYFTGENLRQHLQEEISDVLATLQFAIETNHLDSDFIEKRVADKKKQYYSWRGSPTGGSVDYTYSY